MPHLEFEFSNDTLVVGPRGVERLCDLLHREVKPCVWAIKWKNPDRISFHKSHKHLHDFVALQLDSEAESPARLVNVSEYIYQCVEEEDYCVVNLSDFSEAEKYKPNQ